MLGEQRGSCWYKLCPTLRCCFIVVCACDFLVFKLFSNGQVRLKKKKTNNELFHLYIIVTSSFPTTSVVFKNTNRKDLRRLSLYVKAREKTVCGRSGLGTMADRQFAQCTHLNVMWILLVFIASLKTLTQSDFHLVGFYVFVLTKPEVEDTSSDLDTSKHTTLGNWVFAF